MDKFTDNKHEVRKIQYDTIKRKLKDRLGSLSYFGLPSEEMADIVLWKDLFYDFVVVEREYQLKGHELMLNAFKNRLLGRIQFLKGDIDDIILEGGCDEFGNRIRYAFDVITLDYSGGLFYTEEDGTHYRINVIKKLVEEQSINRTDYLLFVSCKLHKCEDGEVKRLLESLRTDFVRHGENGEEVIGALLAHEYPEVRLKVYLPYVINFYAAIVSYRCSSSRVIFYSGNRGVRMMNFRFYLRSGVRTTAPKPAYESVREIINSPMIQITNGKDRVVTLGLPKLRKHNR